MITSLGLSKALYFNRSKAAADPFFGVCGLRDASEYARLVALAQDVLAGTGRFLAAGVKEIDGDLNQIQKTEAVQPFIHCDYSPHIPYRDIVLHRLEMTSKYACGLQLNVVPWMDQDFAGLWELIRSRYPHIKLVLQAHKVIMERYSPAQITARLRHQPVDYVIFDASQSRGIPYEPGVMLRYISAVYQQDLPIGVVVAGGLSPHSIEAIFEPLIGRYPKLSCDAFFRLYDTSQKRLSWPDVRQYVTTLRSVV